CMRTVEIPPWKSSDPVSLDPKAPPVNGTHNICSGAFRRDYHGYSLPSSGFRTAQYTSTHRSVSEPRMMVELLDILVMDSHHTHERKVIQWLMMKGYVSRTARRLVSREPVLGSAACGKHSLLQ